MWRAAGFLRRAPSAKASLGSRPLALVPENAGLQKRMKSVKVGMVQMTAVNDKLANYEQNKNYLQLAKSQGCEMVFFPECFSFIGARPGEAQEAAEEIPGPTIQKYQDLAASNGIWLSLGGYQEKGPASGDGKIYNTHVVINNTGDIVTTYRKIHLFDVPMTGLVESKQALPGSDLVSCESPVGKLGVTVCYDIRFPELYQKLTFFHGAKVLLVPSAFAMKTGEAHWELLLRCRAIENQCYVIAAAQVGQHNDDGNKRNSWGRSLAIDPWGKVLVDMGTTTGLSAFEIDSELIGSVRDNMPMHHHRRYDLYGDGPHAAGTATAEEVAAQEKKKEGLFFG